MKENLWPKNIQEAKKIQACLIKRVKIAPLKKSPVYVAGVDASFINDIVIGVAALYSYPELEHIKDSISVQEATFPYIPGLLSFREGAVVVSAIKKLKIMPDLILFDGQGIAHPMGIGIASHIGVILNTPTIGCAKSRLVGEFKEPEMTRGSYSFLYYNGKKVGVVLRTRDGVRPLFVSPGHLIDINSSIEIVMNCISRYRIPEPLRRADLVSRKYRNSSFL